MELSPRVRGLVDAARAAGGSTPADRERVFAAVATRVGMTAVASAVVASATHKAAAAATTKGSAMTATTLVIGTKTVLTLACVVAASAAMGTAAVVLSRRPDHGARTAPIAMRTAPPSTLQSAPVVAATLPIRPPVTTPPSEPTESPSAPRVAISLPRDWTVSTPNRPRSAHAAASATRSSVTRPHAAVDAGSLDDEMALLRGAQAAIRVHDGSEAMRFLDEHAARFPHGLLVEERMATAVFALCEMGRRSDAERAAQTLLRAHPQSVHAARVRASCAGGDP